MTTAIAILLGLLALLMIYLFYAVINPERFWVVS
jgi:K+-transporting ATPase KdpF subunit